MTRRLAALALTGLALTGTSGEAQETPHRTVTHARQRGAEPRLDVEVAFGLGRVQVGVDQSGALYRTQLTYRPDLFAYDFGYDAIRHHLRLALDGDAGSRGRGLRNVRDLDQHLTLMLAPGVPTELEMRMGVVEAEIELGGLALTSAEITTGASEGTLRFSRPTTQPCVRLAAKFGAAEFRALGLGNSNCSAMEFTGAAGELELDFTGEWQHTGMTHVQVKVGLGALTLRFPAHIGVRVDLDRLLASFDRSGFERRGDAYYSANFDQAATQLHLDIDAALGDIDVDWVN